MKSTFAQFASTVIMNMRVLKLFFLLLNISIVSITLYLDNCLTASYCGIAILINMLCSFTHTLSHEIGHLIGGLTTGYKLFLFQIGPVCLIIDSNRKPILVLKNSLHSQCVMIPSQTETIRFIAYNSFGTLFNFIFLILCVFLLNTSTVIHSIALIEILLIGIQKIIFNIVPIKTDSIPNDGYNIMILNNCKSAQKDYALYLQLYAHIYLNEPIEPERYLYEHDKSISPDYLIYYEEIKKLLQQKQGH